ncbi:MAG: UDP-glucose 4-epimerase GalE, partial [Gemmatimonadales bacterium]
MKRRVLVTGGAGYIGSVFVDQLEAQGGGAWAVTVLDNLSRGHRAAIAPGARFVEGDIGDRVALARALAGGPTDAIVHFAAYALVPESVTEPEKYRANNVEAARVLLEAALAAGVRRFVFSSSCAVYGHPPAARIPIDEDTPPAPVNPYGETKREFERLLGDAATHSGGALEAISLRYFNAAGATDGHGEDHDPETHLIPSVMQVALGQRPAVEVFGTDYPTADGTAVRDYVHVADLAEAHVRALTATLEGPAAVNLGTGRGYSVREVVAVARRVTG